MFNFKATDPTTVEWTPPDYPYLVRLESSYVTGYPYKAIIEPVVFKIIKETPKGFWIELNGLTEEKKFVLKGEGKRFAHEKIEWALYSFYRRKLSWGKRLNLWQKKLEAELLLAERLKTNPIKLRNEQSMEVWPSFSRDYDY